ncbi:MAG TPA: NAD(P)-binding domain-containing protein [Symbiobacteriaceae bacterium]|nr:NAD(P)-binding domain-containing protein [Symbiobacteriaceae bacterium]
MQIAVIGSGSMGTGLVKVLAGAYESIIWAGRNPARIAQQIAEADLTGRVAAASHQEALAQAEIIILALWHRDLPGFVAQYRSQLAGTTLVHIANPFNEAFSDFTTPWDRSAAEEFQALVPEAHVVGAFKTTWWVVFDQPQFPEGLSDCYVTADDEEAKARVMEALRPLPFRVLDGGALPNNRIIERMTLFARELGRRYKHSPRISWRLLGQ